MYATSNAGTQGTSPIAFVLCPAGDVALGGGGYDSITNDAHIGTIGPITAAVLSTGISGTGNTTLTLTSAGLPFAVASGDTIIVGGANTFDTFTINHTGGYTAGTTSLTVTQTGTGNTIAAGSYVYDTAATAWRPPTSGAGTFPAAPYGWYTTNFDNSASTAYVVCSK